MFPFLYTPLKQGYKINSFREYTDEELIREFCGFCDGYFRLHTCAEEALEYLPMLLMDYLKQGVIKITKTTGITSVVDGYISSHQGHYPKYRDEIYYHYELGINEECKELEKNEQIEVEFKRLTNQ